MHSSAALDAELIRYKNEKYLNEIRKVGYFLGINIKELSKVKIIFARILVITILMSTVFSTYARCCFIVRYRNNFTTAIESFATVTQSIITVIKLVNVLFLQHKHNLVLKVMIEEKLPREIQTKQKDFINVVIIKEGFREIFDSHWKAARRQVGIFLFFCVCSFLFYILTCVSKNAYNNIIGTENYTNVHVLPSYYPMWEDYGKNNKFPYYELMASFDGISTYFGAFGPMYFDTVYIFVIFHAVALLKSLKFMIKFCTTEHVLKAHRIRYLRNCCYYHSQIMKFCEDLIALYSLVVLVQLIQNLIILGFMLFCLVIGLEERSSLIFRTSIYFGAVFVQLFIYCFNGQMLTNESNSLSFCWYDCKWYEESFKFRKIIYMMIIRSNKDIKLTASGFATIDLSTFRTILNTSGSYFLMLRRLTR